MWRVEGQDAQAAVKGVRNLWPDGAPTTGRLMFNYIRPSKDPEGAGMFPNSFAIVVNPYRQAYVHGNTLADMSHKGAVLLDLWAALFLCLRYALKLW